MSSNLSLSGSSNGINQLSSPLRSSGNSEQQRNSRSSINFDVIVRQNARDIQESETSGSEEKKPQRPRASVLDSTFNAPLTDPRNKTFLNLANITNEKRTRKAVAYSDKKTSKEQVSNKRPTKKTHNQMMRSVDEFICAHSILIVKEKYQKAVNEEARLRLQHYDHDLFAVRYNNINYRSISPVDVLWNPYS